MPVIAEASVEQIRRLLELFPSSAIKTEWPGVKGEKKDGACEIIAGTGDRDRVGRFVISNFSHCRQHVLLMQQLTADADPLAVFPAPELLGIAPTEKSFYLSVVPYTTYLLSPMEECHVDVLWPLRVERRDRVVAISTIVLERDPKNYSGRPCIKAIRNFDEKKVPMQLASLGFLPLDINMGVKALWESKFMDAFRVSYKKTTSVATEVMDEEAGLRDTAPEVYEQITSKPLLNTSFKPAEESEVNLGPFLINATQGRIGFTSYTDELGDVDALVDAVLAANQ
jgi:hypothetical protein